MEGTASALVPSPVWEDIPPLTSGDLPCPHFVYSPAASDATCVSTPVLSQMPPQLPSGPPILESNVQTNTAHRKRFRQQPASGPLSSKFSLGPGSDVFQELQIAAHLQIIRTRFVLFNGRGNLLQESKYPA